MTRMPDKGGRRIATKAEKSTEQNEFRDLQDKKVKLQQQNRHWDLATLTTLNKATDAASSRK